jgi:23S rRNA (guanosine2251-2'-O)-methyltransferase
MVLQLNRFAFAVLPPSPRTAKLKKTALGATLSVNWTYYETPLQAVEQLRNEGYQIIAVEQAENSTMLHEFKPDPSKKYALIFGNEVNGVSDEVMQTIDACIEIPQFGTKHSI